MIAKLAIGTLNNDPVNQPDQSFDTPLLYGIKKAKTRLLVQKGIENVLLRLEDIVFFYTQNKVVYVVDRFGKKYLSDHSLADLEMELNPMLFFRANRQYIINIDFIRSFKPFEKVKIKVDMNLHEVDPCIVISQETAPAFRKWMHEA
jgi:DNA-binding LytR/AlgR family response regulator